MKPLLEVGVTFQVGFKCGCSAKRNLLVESSAADIVFRCPSHRASAVKEDMLLEVAVLAAAIRTWEQYSITVEA